MDGSKLSGMCKWAWMDEATEKEVSYISDRMPFWIQYCGLRV
jgi:hypothetical protein